MKTLYITDLDGTFLNNDAVVSEFAITNLKKMIDKGLLFTVATARTYATVKNLFKGINLNIPLILMNGVLIFDPSSEKNLFVHTISKETASKIINIYRKYNITPMLYFLGDSNLEIHYENVFNKHQEKYICNRDNLNYKKFYQVDKLDINNGKLIYMVSLDESFKLTPIYNEIISEGNVSCAFYSDNYTECNFMECMNINASKGSAAEKLKKLLGVDRIVAYGDNLNDLTLCDIADEFYAVANACEEVKSVANSIVESNAEDGVIKHIMNNFYNK